MVSSRKQLGLVIIKVSVRPQIMTQSSAITKRTVLQSHCGFHALGFNKCI